MYVEVAQQVATPFLSSSVFSLLGVLQKCFVPALSFLFLSFVGACALINVYVLFPLFIVKYEKLLFMHFHSVILAR